MAINEFYHYNCNITNPSILINVSLSKMIDYQRIVDLDDSVQDGRDKPGHEGNYYQEVSLHVIYNWSILHSVEPDDDNRTLYQVKILHHQLTGMNTFTS